MKFKMFYGLTYAHFINSNLRKMEFKMFSELNYFYLFDYLYIHQYTVTMSKLHTVKHMLGL